MADWDRKNLNTLHGAINNSVSAIGVLDMRKVQLIGIKNQFSMSLGNEAKTLRKCRVDLCEVCRGNKMYECDVKEGWSPTCAFIKANSP